MLSELDAAGLVCYGRVSPRFGEMQVEQESFGPRCFQQPLREANPRTPDPEWRRRCIGVYVVAEFTNRR